MRASEFLDESISIPRKGIKKTVDGVHMLVTDDGSYLTILAVKDSNDFNKHIAYVVFERDGRNLVASSVSVKDPYKGQGIAKMMYDFANELGFKIRASDDQTAAGRHFWQKNRGEERVWEQRGNIVNEYLIPDEEAWMKEHESK